MGEGYHQFEDNTINNSNQLEILDGPSLNDDCLSTTTIRKRKFRKPRWCNDRFKVLVVVTVIFSLVIATALFIDISLRSPSNGSVEVITDSPKCTEIVNDLLKNTKANAVDAAICGMVCSTVVMPDQTSLASGGFMTLHTDETTKTIDFQFIVSDVYNQTKDKQGNLPVAVPGFIEGMKIAHKNHGNIAWYDIISPSVELAKHGFTVSESLAKNIKGHYSSFSGNMKKAFIKHGQPVKAGDVLKIDGMVDALRHILYQQTKELNEDVLEMVNSKFDLQWTEETLKVDVITEKPPTTTKFKEATISSSSGPSSGASLISAMNILRKLKPHATNTSESYRQLAQILCVMLESQKLVGTNELLSDDYATKKAEEIRLKTLKCGQQSSDTGSQSSNTKLTTGAKVTIIDRDGEVVSAVSSLGHLFGSKVMTDLGVVLNNGVEMFKETGKVASPLLRVPSFASPAIAFNRKSKKKKYGFVASTDREGLSALLQVLKNHFLDGLSLDGAADRARIIYDQKSNGLIFEGKRETSDEIVDSSDYLREFYTTVGKSPRGLGHVICATRDEKDGRTVQR